MLQNALESHRTTSGQLHSPATNRLVGWLLTSETKLSRTLLRYLKPVVVSRHHHFPNFQCCRFQKRRCWQLPAMYVFIIWLTWPSNADFGCLGRLRVSRGCSRRKRGHGRSLTLRRHVGNTMASFVMQYLGCEVSGLNTVQFSTELDSLVMPQAGVSWLWGARQPHGLQAVRGNQSIRRRNTVDLRGSAAESPR